LTYGYTLYILILKVYSSYILANENNLKYEKISKENQRKLKEIKEDENIKGK